MHSTEVDLINQQENIIGQQSGDVNEQIRWNTKCFVTASIDKPSLVLYIYKMYDKDKGKDVACVLKKIGYIHKIPAYLNYLQ